MTVPEYPQLKHLDKLLKGEISDRKAVEIAIYDKEGKMIKLFEGTLPNEVLWGKKDFRLLPNKKKHREYLGKTKGKGHEALKLYYYPPNRVNENPSFLERVPRGLAVAEGGIHPVMFSLSIQEAKELRNRLDRLIYRLKRRRKL